MKPIFRMFCLLVGMSLVACNNKNIKIYFPEEVKAVKSSAHRQIPGTRIFINLPERFVFRGKKEGYEAPDNKISDKIYVYQNHLNFATRLADLDSAKSYPYAELLEAKDIEYNGQKGLYYHIWAANHHVFISIFRWKISGKGKSR